MAYRDAEARRRCSRRARLERAEVDLGLAVRWARGVGLGSFYAFHEWLMGRAAADRRLDNGLGDCDVLSPLILDLDGDGVEADGLAYFDHEGDGWGELSRWAGEDDGVLVWDRNRDGVINDGSELFGNNTVLRDGGTAKDGFAALSDLDDNGDGVIDGKDGVWVDLRVMRWTDANGDGVRQDGESVLVTLGSLGIGSLGTDYVESSRVDGSGNEHRQVGSFSKTDGTTGTMTDVWLMTSPAMSSYDRTGIPVHSVAVGSLPDVSGGGRVYGLHDAMALDDAKDGSGNSCLLPPYYGGGRTEVRSLREMVSSFVATDAEGDPRLDRSARLALAEKILLRWAGAEGVRAQDYGADELFYTEAHKLAVVEAFQGEQWHSGRGYRGPSLSAAQKVERGYQSHLERLYGQLMLESHLGDLQKLVKAKLKEGAEAGSTNPEDYTVDFSAVAALLSGGSDARRGEWLRSIAALYGSGENSAVILSSIRETAPDWVYEYQYYAEYLERGVYDGDVGGSRDEFIGDCGCGGGLRDNVFRTTDGGADRLEGRGGDDTYHLGYGTGHDRIEEGWRDSDFAGDGNDVIKVAPGISTERVKLSRTRDDLVVSLLDEDGGVESSLTVADHYANAAARVEKVLFSDGTVWGAGVLQSAVLASGRGGSGVDTYDGGGVGINAVMQGGEGGDVYWLGRGSGRDRIDEAAYNRRNNGDMDIVRLRSGLTAGDVRLSRTREDLVISVLSSDKSAVDSVLTVANYYATEAAKVERVELHDGTLLWNAEQLDAVALADAGSGDDELTGTAGSDVMSGHNGGDDTLRGGGGSDVYWFGRGSGNDTVDEGYRNFGSAGDVVRLRRNVKTRLLSLSRDKYDLIIRLRGAETLTIKNYYVNDAAKIERVERHDGTLLWDSSDFAGVRWTAPVYAAGASPIRGGAGVDYLNGLSGTNDVFDSNAGGNDILRGRSGDDVYWLGRGTGHDIVDDDYQNAVGDAGDVIKIKAGIGSSSVRLVRSNDGEDLFVQLLDTRGRVTDSLKVDSYYTKDGAKVERLEFSDGKVWDAGEFMRAALRGGLGGDYLNGLSGTNDVFDGAAGGNDTLRGRGGDDVYWLGRGTGHDVIDEDYQNAAGDSGDVIKIKAGIGVSLVRLARSNDGEDLFVQLLDTRGRVSDSLKVDGYYTSDSSKVERVEFMDGTVWDADTFMRVAMRGGVSGDYLEGLSDADDVFDGDAGGNDTLRGRGGDDVYWLGRGTGHDVVNEGYGNSAGDSGDEIRVKAGIASSSVRLMRSNDGRHLSVQLLDGNGRVTDSLKVEGYYTGAKAKVERVRFVMDGTVWDANDFMGVAIRGGASGDYLEGLSGTDDVFDGDMGGNDTFRGRGGDDVYWLGKGTGHDVVNEGHENAEGDGGDVIRIKAGIAPSSVRLVRSNDGRHLFVRLLDARGRVSDSLRVENYYADDSAKIERVEFMDGAGGTVGTVWDANDFMRAAIRGLPGGGDLYGLSDTDDVFDSDAGSNDILRGRGGDDVYWLGRGADHDVVDEGYENAEGDAGDVIRIKAGIAPSSVRLLRSGDGRHLFVQLLGADGRATDSLKVDSHYANVASRVERVEFMDGVGGTVGTVWDSNDLMGGVMRGGVGDDSLEGLSGSDDVFDSDAGGNDLLRGRSGDDVYWLGRGTGHDTIEERHENAIGDAGDVIRIKAGIAPSSVRLVRSDYGIGRHLIVQLLGADGEVTDSLTVDRYYWSIQSEVERVEFMDGAGGSVGTVWDAEDFMNAPIRGGSGDDTLVGDSTIRNVFDGDAGGNDRLVGRGDGVSVYWLGRGTGHDIVDNRWSGYTSDVIRIKAGIAPSSVRLVRSDDGEYLHVQLLNTDGEVTDSLRVNKVYYHDTTSGVERVEFMDGAGGTVGTVWDAEDFMRAPIRGGTGDDELYGLRFATDMFDSAAGGNDILRGHDNGDVYWLGKGTGHDTVDEGYGNADSIHPGDDVIRIKPGIAPFSVRLARSDDGKHLLVQLLGADGRVTDSLKVDNHYADDPSRIERVEFMDGEVGTVWDANDFMRLVIRGGGGDDELYGLSHTGDVFDGDAGGNDTLRGRGGDDVYWLGYGTGHDTVDEGHENDTGDAGDVIRMKAGIAPSSVRLVRSGDGKHLFVQLLGANRTVTDLLKVEDYYADSTARIERVEFMDGTVWDAEDFMQVAIRGGDDVDKLYGLPHMSDVFDSGVGDDTLYGRSGDDVYWLGRGTGHDTVEEWRQNDIVGADDVIRIKSGIAPSSVRLVRSDGGGDLYVQLLNASGDVTDSLTVRGHYYNGIELVEFMDGEGGSVGTVWDVDDFMQAPMRGGTGDDFLAGWWLDINDVFDSNAGGNDTLRGGRGDDVYWLGRGTGHDTIDGGGSHYFQDAGDVIKMKSGIAPSSARFLRSDDGKHLLVQLLGADGEVTDSLRVKNYYTSTSLSIGWVEFMDGADGTVGTVWNAEDFMRLADDDSDGSVPAVLRGGSDDEDLVGSKGNNVFDSDAGGNDRLHGRGGDDVYWLGRGTGRDTIYEWWRNGVGDAGDDVIRIKPGIAPSSVRLVRLGYRHGYHYHNYNYDRNLYVQVLGADGKVTDSLTVDNYYADDRAKVERVEFMDGEGGTVGTVWDADDLMQVAMRGVDRRVKDATPARGPSHFNDQALFGVSGGSDVFDSAAGRHHLYGASGDDVYWLGRGTGHDTVYENWRNSVGDAGDVIKIKSGVAPSSVRISRSDNGMDLCVHLLDTDGNMSDSLTVKYYYTTDNGKIERVEFMDGEEGTVGTVWDADDFAQVAIWGGDDDDKLYGLPGRSDVFDGAAGGDDTLHGRGGNDMYWLGKGTGHDTIVEWHENGAGDTNDVIRIKSGVAPSSVRLSRSEDGVDLLVQLLGTGGKVTDSLTVSRYYTDETAKVERVEFMDGVEGAVGTVWGADDFAQAAIRGGDGGDKLYGFSGRSDVFDSGAGNDTLYGRSGDDVYWLGYGTGRDTINEGYQNAGGDANDVIRIKAGIAPSSVRLVRSDRNDYLHVQLLDSDGNMLDSLTVEHHYTTDNAKIERVEFMDGEGGTVGTVWDADDLAQVAIRGPAGQPLYGVFGVSDVFDSAEGGNNRLHGHSGDDVYWLGYGTGHDAIIEWLSNTTGDPSDVIRIKPGIAPSSILLARSDDGRHLLVQLLNASGKMSDSLTVDRHYTADRAEIERVEFMDGVDGTVGTIWDADDFAQATIRGRTEGGELHGLSHTDDVFDSDAGGDDRLHGYGGNDVYWLGYGTGDDVVLEWWRNPKGDDGDVIRIKAGIAPSSVRLSRVEEGGVSHLLVQLLDKDGVATDSLRVDRYYTDETAKIERIEFMGGADGTVGTVWDANDLMRPVAIRGDGGDDRLYGSWRKDAFDSDAGGNDRLYGRGGDDAYWLGRGTGHDTIDESYGNAKGDTGDVIRIKSGIAPSSVRLMRSGDAKDLLVQLLAANGKVSDSLRVENYYANDAARVERVEFMDGAGGSVGTVWYADDLMWPAAMRGGAGDDRLHGSSVGDVFDSDAGGDDSLYGYGGDDVYWLGRGTGHDIIDESYGNAKGDAGDVIRIKAGISSSSVRLVRSDDGHLLVRLLDADGKVSDSLTVRNYYRDDAARVEQVKFMDGTVWGADDLMRAAIRGSAGNDILEGLRDSGDVFDGDAGGDDTLRGRGGDDVYWLGRGTGHDTIDESYENAEGDTGDVIRIKAGIAPSSVRLVRSDDGKHFLVQLLDAGGEVTDSLTMEDYYTDETARIERVEFMDGAGGTVGTVWDAGEFMRVAIRGGVGDDRLYGLSWRSDVFDSDAGGDDRLRGRSGDDVYWLGRGTGHDTIDEGYQNAIGDDGDVIRIKPGIVPSSVRLVYSDDGKHLFVRLLDAAGKVSDSLTVENYYTDETAKIERVEFVDGVGGTVGTVWDDKYFPLVVRGSDGDDRLYGSNGRDVFDGDAGGNDRLHGRGGDDVYWLGYGTGHDTIDEGYGNVGGNLGDVIRIKSGIAPSSVRLVRSEDGEDLIVQLLGTDGNTSDSLTVENYYSDDAAQVERVEFLDGEGGTVGTVWDANDLMRLVAILGGVGDDQLYGSGGRDVFDSDARGDDRLHGRGGNDVYWLGRGTGHDTIDEGYENVGGDAGDVIRIKSGIAPSSIRLVRSDDGEDLIVQLLDTDGKMSDSLTVENYYTDNTARIEQVKFMDGTVWDADDLMRPAAILGGAGDDQLHGSGGRDVFDSDAGGNDDLHGRGGDDVYWLGRGTGHDFIDEGYENAEGDAGDIIRIKPGIAPSSVRFLRSYDGKHLFVRLLDTDGEVSDSLTVENYYADGTARIEQIKFMDGVGGLVGTVWDTDDFDLPVRGGVGHDWLYGSGGRDVFDSDAGGDDRLHGRGGDDVYWLGRGTGHDTIDEGYENVGGDSGDVIRIKPGIAPSSVRLVRSDDGEDLVVGLLDTDGEVTDSLTIENYYTDGTAQVERVEFMDGAVGTVWHADDLMRPAAILGGVGDDRLYGLSWRRDLFDSDVGGDDRLYGRGGDDVYWLGRGTGHDTIDEGYENIRGDAGDVIRIKFGIAPSSVRLVRSYDGKHLFVRLLDINGGMTDSLKVENYYTDNAARIEQVEFMDGVDGAVGTVWHANDLMRPAAILGSAGNDWLYGSGGRDVFDSDAGGDDRLHGRGGDDVYWLGYGTGHDTIDEGYENVGGDSGDVIRIKPGIAPSSVRLVRSDDGRHLFVRLLDVNGGMTDSLKVENYYTDNAARIEQVVFMDGVDGLVGTVWHADDLMRPAAILGSAGNDQLHGSEGRDVFDSDAGGNDRLHGRGGDDVYWLGRGTGYDTIDEGYENAEGDAGDVIRIKPGIAPSSVRLARSDDGRHLFVRLFDTISGEATDLLKVENYYTDNTARIEQVVFMDGVGGLVGTVWDADDFVRVPIRGGFGHDWLYGSDGKDVFDSDAGGNDDLHGRGGDDVYWLGYGTGHDTIDEGYENVEGDAGDVIRIKSGIAPSSVRLARSDDGRHLFVRLFDTINGEATDSLKVENYYTDNAARIEQVEFMDGTVWDANDLMRPAAILGGVGDDQLYGSAGRDVFDSDAGGNDRLRGRGGDDVYWLGRGTGHDTIDEGYENAKGDAGDVIRIKPGIAPSSVRLVRSNDGKHLIVWLLGANGEVTDSLTVGNYYTDNTARIEQMVFMDGVGGLVGTVWHANDLMRPAAILGSTGNDQLLGSSRRDVFDGNAGGDDLLRGRGGDDVYWLGRGTGHDAIDEGYENAKGDAGDVIRIKPGIAPSSVRLARSNDGKGLVVGLLDANGGVSDSLTVENYYTDGTARIEQVKFMDGVGGLVGTVWDADNFVRVPIRGGAGDDRLYGLSGMDDVFDSDAGGRDILFGYSGDDVYWLGRGTGHDVVIEFFRNYREDTGDVIKVKSGIGVNDVRLRRAGGDLYVEIVGENNQVTDSLRVYGHFYGHGPRASVESVEADGKVLFMSEYQKLIDAVAAFEGGDRSAFATEQALYNHFWSDDTTLTSPGS